MIEYQQMSQITVAAFYQFCSLSEYKTIRPAIHDICTKNAIRGIILLAPEGINGTIAGSDEAIGIALAAIHQTFDKFHLRPKLSFTNEMPFLRMKVRLKSEIVTLGVPDIAPHEKTGKLVDPIDWNGFIESGDVTLIDVRNNYEIKLGAFERAINPKTKSFSEFPNFIDGSQLENKNKKIALYCTGGIRCEKASAYMLHLGFTEVYQLSGGVLRYLEVVKPEQSKWRGSCFVFDKRVAVGHGVKPADVELCFGCLMPLTPDDQNSPRYELGVCCAHCFSIRTARQKASSRERIVQMELARKRNEKHLGPRIQSNEGTSTK